MSMLGSNMKVLQQTPASNKKPAHHNPKYSRKVNRVPNQIKEEYNISNMPLKNHELSKDNHHTEAIPHWYQKELRNKVNRAENRLQKLSYLVCATCPSTATYIRKIEEDHNTIFCKMDDPRVPPLDKPWTNLWKFDCRIQCKERNNSEHNHTGDCQSLVMEYWGKEVSFLRPNICQYGFPQHILDALKLIQDFAADLTKTKPIIKSPDCAGTVYDKSMWTKLKIIVRTNNLNEFMLTIHGKKSWVLVPHLNEYFESGSGSNSNVKSVLYFHKRSKTISKKTYEVPMIGPFELKDTVGPISVLYDAVNHCLPFNSVETLELSKIIEDYMNLTKDTTLLDIGCELGVLSLIMAHKCKKVIGLNSKISAFGIDVSHAEILKEANKIHNATFLECHPNDILTTCLPLVKESNTVAILNLSSGYCCKNFGRYAMEALRKMPSISKLLIYGSFAKDFHRTLSVLTTEVNSLGECFLPVRACVLDKCPLLVKELDIITLFQRKSLIEKNLELLTPTPTLDVNLKIENDSLLDTKKENFDLSSVDSKLENSNKDSMKKLLSSPVIKKESQQITNNQDLPGPFPSVDKKVKSELTSVDSKLEISKENSSKRSLSSPVIKKESQMTSNHDLPMPLLSMDKNVKSELTSMDSKLENSKENSIKRLLSSPVIKKESQQITNNKDPLPTPLLSVEKKVNSELTSVDSKLENSKKNSKKRSLSPPVTEKEFQQLTNNQGILPTPALPVRREFCFNSLPPRKLGRQPARWQPPFLARNEFQFNHPPPVLPFHPHHSLPLNHPTSPVQRFSNPSFPSYPPPQLNSPQSLERFANPSFPSYPPLPLNPPQPLARSSNPSFPLYPLLPPPQPVEGFSNQYFSYLFPSIPLNPAQPLDIVSGATFPANPVLPMHPPLPLETFLNPPFPLHLPIQLMPHPSTMPFSNLELDPPVAVSSAAPLQYYGAPVSYSTGHKRVRR